MTADPHIRFGTHFCTVLVVYVVISGLGALHALDSSDDVALSTPRRTLALIQNLPSGIIQKKFLVENLKRVKIPQIDLWCDTSDLLIVSMAAKPFLSIYLCTYKHWWDSNRDEMCNTVCVLTI